MSSLAPPALVVAAAAGATWKEQGSIAAGDWLPWAMLCAVVLGALLASGTAVAVGRRGRVMLTAAVALALWDAASIGWAPDRAAARDEALLVLTYALVLGVSALGLRSAWERIGALGLVALLSGVTVVAAAAKLVADSSEAGDFFTGGRLSYPISYINALAAVCLIGFWPAIAIAARRGLPLAVRGVALGLAAAGLAGELLTQSKGAALGIVASAVVVAGAGPAAMRLLVPALLAAVCVAPAALPLTAPYRAGANGRPAAAEHAGAAALAVVAGAIVVGCLYALLDRRVVPHRRVARRAALALALLAGVAVIGVGLAAAVRPAAASHDAHRLWVQFRGGPTSTGATHFESFGSNRYDFWRVAAHTAAAHPLVGIGARGFGTVYLRERRSSESPIRAHSLPLDVFAETGIVGLCLLLALFWAPLRAARRRIRSAHAAAALGTGTYFLVHSSVDWIWTFPAVGIPLFLVLGTALRAGGRRLAPRAAAAGFAGVAVVLVVGFLPVWLSAQIDSRSLTSGSPRYLGLAATLDPLSPDPFVTKGLIARTPAAEAAALRDAVARAPSAPDLRLLYASALRRAGKRQAARAQVERAHALDPRRPVSAAR